MKTLTVVLVGAVVAILVQLVMDHFGGPGAAGSIWRPALIGALAALAAVSFGGRARKS